VLVLKMTKQTERGCNLPRVTASWHQAQEWDLRPWALGHWSTKWWRWLHSCQRVQVPVMPR